MKNTLKPGLHVAIVTSPKPGYGGSMLAWETYEVCKRVGIPAIFATFDRFRAYPPSIETDLRRLPVSESPVATEEEVANCLLSIVKEAKVEGKFLIIDTKAGHYPHHPMFTALMRAELGKADSIAALVAVWSGIDKSRDPYAESGITFDRTIFRCWGFKSDLSRAPSDDKTHRWIPRFLSRNAVIEINEGSSVNSATVMHDSSHGIRLDEHSGYSDEVVAHLDDATAHIFPTLLKPIIDTAPEGGAAAF